MKEPERKSTVYLIVGFVGAGKTSFAKKLEKESGALRFTKDEWIISIFGHDPRIDNFDKYDERIMNLAFDIAFKCVEAGIDVILDDGFWVRSQRDEMRDRIKKAGANCQIYYVKCSEETVKKRIRKRNEKPTEDVFLVDEAMYDSLKKYFDELTEDEEHIVIENG
jgi:predicted kinase